MDSLTLAKLTFENGLIESQEASADRLDGFVTELLNWVPEPTGGVRARVGWDNASTTSAPATRKTRGIGVFKAHHAYDEPARVRNTKGSQSTAATTVNLALNFAGAGTAGNTYIAVIGCEAAGAVTSFTTPSGWFKAGESISGTMGCAIFYRNMSGTGATFPVVFSTAGTNVVAGVLGEYTNLEDEATILSSAGTNSGTISTATPAGKQMDSGVAEQPVTSWGLAVAGFAGGNNVATSAPTEGFAKLDEDTTSILAAFYDRIMDTAVGVPHTKVTFDASNQPWASCIATFKADEASSVTSYDKYIVANQNSGSEFKLYTLDRSNLSAGTWALVDTISGLSGSMQAYVPFANGEGQSVFIHPTFPLRKWNGSTASGSITGAPANGRSVCFHAGRFYVGGNSTQPTRLYYSKLHDPVAWDTSTDYVEVGTDDGEPIEDIVSFGSGLLIAKKTSLWVLNGTGPDNYSLEGPFSGGAYPGKPMCVTPDGVVCAAEKRVYLWTGAGAQEISKPIEQNYSLTGDFVSVAYSDRKAYVCDEGAGMSWVIDLETGTWHQEDANSNSTHGYAVMFSDQEKLLYGPQNSTTISLVAYRSFPGTRDRDASLGMDFTLRTPQLWLQGTETPITPRHLWLRLRQRSGTTGEASLSVVPTYDGTAIAARTVATRASAGTFWTRLDIGDNSVGRGIRAMQFYFTHSPTSAQTTLFDIEEVIVGYLEEPVR